MDLKQLVSAGSEVNAILSKNIRIWLDEIIQPDIDTFLLNDTLRIHVIIPSKYSHLDNKTVKNIFRFPF